MQGVVAQPKDAIFALNNKCNADSFAQKLNLGIGAYRTSEGKPYVFEVVKEVRRALRQPARRAVFSQ